MNAPLVSVLIPAYNCAKYLTETLKSVQNQTYQNIEIIVVNNSSTDLTLDVLESLLYVNITYITQENKGAATARNKAFEICKGDYIKFLDADDLLNPESIENQVNLLNKNPNCIISGKWGRFYNDDINTFKLNPQNCWQTLAPKDWIEQSWIETSPMMQPGIFLIPRHLILQNGLWDTRLTLIDDFEYGIRILLKAEKIIFCDQSVLKYRSGITNNLSGQKTYKAAKSALLATQLVEKELLKAENSFRMKQIISDSYFQFILDFYLIYNDLVKIAEKSYQNYPKSRLTLEGGRGLMLLKKIFGWKIAKRLRMML